MVFEKKQLSKALAIALMVACAVAFMPLLNGQAFAAAKKPAKVKSLKAVQVTDTMKAKVTWKKGKNCKKYNVKVDGKIVKKNQKAKSYTTADLTEGAHKIAVAGVNGKKVGKYKTVTVNIVTPKTALKGVAIQLKDKATDIKVGDTLTAVVDPAGATATYQWSRVSSTGLITPIEGATGSTYKVQGADIESKIKVDVTGTDKYEGSVEAITQVAVAKDSTKAALYLEDPDAPVYVGVPVTIVVNTDEAVTFAWYENGKVVAGANSNTYTPQTAGATLECKATVGGKVFPPEGTNPFKWSVISTTDVAADYNAAIVDNTTGKAFVDDVKKGDVLKAQIVQKADPTKEYSGSALSYTWTYQILKDEKTGETEEYEDTTSGKTLEITEVIAKYNQGKDIKVTIKVAPTKDYAGSVSASVKAGSEVPATIALKNAPANVELGDTLTVDKVTGNLGSDMTTAVTISWKALVVNEDGSTSWKVLGTGTTLEVTRDVFDAAVDNGIIAAVDGTKVTTGTGIKSVATSISVVALTTEAYGDQQMLPPDKALAYKLYTAQIDGKEVKTAEEGTDYVAEYYVNGTKTTADAVKTLTPGAKYSVKILPTTPTASKYFNVIGTPTDEETAGTVKEDYTLAIKCVDTPATADAEATYKAEPYEIGDELIVEGTFPATYSGYVPATPKWYLDSVSAKNEIAGKEDGSLVVKKDYVGHKIVAVSDGAKATAGAAPAGKYFNKAQATTAQEIAKADLAVSYYESIDPVAVGATVCPYTNDDPEATFKVYAVGASGQIELPLDTELQFGEYKVYGTVIPAAAMGMQLKVVATPSKDAAAIYNETSKQFTETIGAAVAAPTVEITADNPSTTKKYEVGDSFTVKVTPADAVDASKIEWYRGDTKIATGATYALTEDDATAAAITAKIPKDACDAAYQALGTYPLVASNSIFYANETWTLGEPVPALTANLSVNGNTASVAVSPEGTAVSYDWYLKIGNDVYALWEGSYPNFNKITTASAALGTTYSTNMYDQSTESRARFNPQRNASNVPVGATVYAKVTGTAAPYAGDEATTPVATFNGSTWNVAE